MYLTNGIVTGVDGPRRFPEFLVHELLGALVSRDTPVLQALDFTLSRSQRLSIAVLQRRAGCENAS